MITHYFRSVKEGSLQQVKGVRPGTWVHVENPSNEEIDELSKLCGLSRDLLQDAVDFYEVPRFESEKGIAYFFTRFPHEKDSEMGTAPIMFTVTPTAVVSVARERPACLDQYINGKMPLYTTQRTKLFLLLVQAIHTSYRKTLIAIRRDVQKSRVNIRKIRTNDIVRLVSLESTLNDFISALTPTYTALKTVLSGTYLQLYDDDRDIVEDIQLEDQQLVETAKASLKTIQNIRSAYMAIVTNNLNAVMKVLTSITIILTIPTVIGSLYGMNILLPYANAPHAFYGITLLILGTMGLAAWLFAKRDWL